MKWKCQFWINCYMKDNFYFLLFWPLISWFINIFMKFKHEIKKPIKFFFMFMYSLWSQNPVNEWEIQQVATDRTSAGTMLLCLWCLSASLYEVFWSLFLPSGGRKVYKAASYRDWKSNSKCHIKYSQRHYWNQLPSGFWVCGTVTWSCWSEL